MQTAPGDILLIHQDGKPVGYARVEEILADHKPGWWHLAITVLGLPAQELTWILRDEYIDGGEFTMGGQPMRLERLPPPRAFTPPAPSEPEPKPDSGGGKVVSLRPRK